MSRPDESGFEWATGLGDGVCAFTTTRHGGVSRTPYESFNLGDHVGDSPDAVRTNRAALGAFVPQEPVWLAQVHGTAVHEADRSALAAPCGPVTADAAITSQPGQVLAILTADCMPVVLFSPDQRILGVAHAGWRGLADGILIRTVGAMRQRSDALRDLRAWIGPTIGPAAFQVGPEVRQRFLADDPGLDACFVQDKSAPGKWLADLCGIARKQLLAQGVGTVHVCGACTVNDPGKRFFSYRRDGQTGRMATLAWMVS